MERTSFLAYPKRWAYTRRIVDNVVSCRERAYTRWIMGIAVVSVAFTLWWGVIPYLRGQIPGQCGDIDRACWGGWYLTSQDAGRWVPPRRKYSETINPKSPLPITICVRTAGFLFSGTSWPWILIFFYQSRIGSFPKEHNSPTCRACSEIWRN